jgi:hypothetical protein
MQAAISTERKISVIFEVFDSCAFGDYFESFAGETAFLFSFYSAYAEDLFGDLICILFIK